MTKATTTTLLFLSLALAAPCQTGTRSPYSQYGLGAMRDQSQGFSRGMNGVGIALRLGNTANTLNPAAYSAVDSLTMLFDVALAGQVTNYKEHGSEKNVKGGGLEYIVGTFRLLKDVGMSFGLLPYSTIDYEYTTSKFLDNTYGTVSETYSGSGGLHQAFLGVGWRVTEPLSLGLNVAYLWGKQDKTVTTGSTTYINSLSKNYSALFNSYNIQVGAQWEQRLSKEDMLTIGATASIGHSLGSEAKYMIVNSNSTTGNRDTTMFTASDGFKIPWTYGLGLGWTHKENLFVEADVTLQKWGGTAYPDYDAAANAYVKKEGLLKDRCKVGIGADWVPNPAGRKFFSRVHYRMGAGLATPYYKINGANGPKEMSVSAGMGLPLQNSWNSRGNMRPVLNISAQWARAAATGLITENTFRINIGLTFNERWFAKWKVN